ncbi:cyclic AMP-responsive element-binding protein 3-like protein 2 [Clarias magur]|uniref:Cyclic AMP-responsive element-binding protein 3-like protein 2 n=1 Tax=Clarias magur TaxID=1594786 RepID=A0A8J4TJ31_CLAMG|nr:cyclic AMP-responsive element-binding protein 3-like protein 2 [Clarias magur]
MTEGRAGAFSKRRRSAALSAVNRYVAEGCGVDLPSCTVQNLFIVRLQGWRGEGETLRDETKNQRFFPSRLQEASDQTLWYAGCETRPLKHPAGSRSTARVGCRLSNQQLLALRRNLGRLTGTAQALEHFTELLDDLSQEALLGQLLSDPFLSGRGHMMDLEKEEEELSPASPPPPHIQAEHSYSLSGDSRPQSPLSHLILEKTSSEPVCAGESDSDDWPMEQQQQEEDEEMEDDEEEEDKLNLKMEPLLCDSPALLPTVTLTLTVKPATAASLSQTTQLVTQAKEDESFSPQIKLEPHEVDQFLNLSPKELETLQMPPTPPSSHGSDTEGSQSPVRSCAPASPTSNPAILKVAQRTTASLPNSLSNSPLLTAPHKLQGSGPLLLTEEERRTLIAEGYPVPNKLPLSKSEEKALKKIRRKIKNKISAQESRRKKKEYVDALEKKVETCSNENSELRRKVENLESTNKSLLQQLHSLQAMVTGKVPRSCKMASTQTSTCLMAVVLCFAVFLGSFYQGLSPCSSITKSDLSRELTMQESYTTTVKSRSLLSFEEHGVGDEPRPSGLGGEYPEWDTQSTAMMMWRLEQQRRLQQATPQTPEPSSPFVQNNGTNTQKAVLIDLHTHRSAESQSNEMPNIINLERTVNEPS